MKNKPTPLKILTRGALVFFLAALAIGFTGLLIGCDSDLSSVNVVEPQDEINFFELTYDPEALAKKPGITIETVVTYEAYISAMDGGVILLDEIEVAEGGELLDRVDAVDESVSVDAFVIQPNSIPYDVSFIFQITKITTIDGDMPVVYDCNPDGLVFSKSAILLVNAWKQFGKNTEEVVFYYLDEETNQWQEKERVQVSADGLAATSIDHFSRYGADGPPTDGGRKTDSPGGGTVTN